MANTFSNATTKPYTAPKINKSPMTKMAAVRVTKGKKTNPFSRSLVQAGPSTKYKNV